MTTAEDILQELPVTGSDTLLESGRQLVEQIRVNVHAAYVCKAYYLSHVWMKVTSCFGVIMQTSSSGSCH